MRHGSLPTVENTILWYSMRMRHSHEYNDVNPMAEQRTRLVVLLTVVMMIIEISAGWKFKSMALLADGWHMSSHAIALGLSAAAYTLARRLARDERFAFGTWKIEILGGYTSAIFLVGVVIYMGWESVTRLFHPATIAALAGGKYLGATWLDPVMGIVGSVIVAAWAFTLLRDTGRILLDAEMDAPVVARIRNAVCGGRVATTIDDLHVWRVGKGKFACVLSVETAEAVSPDEIRSLLSVHEELTHVTVEVNRRA